MHEGHSMSSDPELYIWLWAKSIKFHKQKNLIILISYHFEFFELDQYSQSYCWLKFAVFPFKFCIYFVNLVLWHKNPYISFLSVNIFSWNFARMCQKVCLLKINHWHFPYDLWTYVNQGQVGHSFCVHSCMAFVCTHAWPYFNCLWLGKVNWYEARSCFIWKL